MTWINDNWKPLALCLALLWVLNDCLWTTSRHYDTAYYQNNLTGEMCTRLESPKWGCW